MKNEEFFVLIDYLEQVSHHPPAFAQHTEGQGWTFYQEFTMSSKFRGQYLSVTPLGNQILELLIIKSIVCFCFLRLLSFNF